MFNIRRDLGSDHRWSRMARSVSAIAVLTAMAGDLAAQEQTGQTASDEDDQIALEEIVVTATRRAQSLQDVGISVTALSARDIADFGFQSAEEVTALAPGVSTVQPNGVANFAIAMRGAANSDFTSNQESPVAVYVDDVYLSQMSGAGFLLYDMERVEMLRGPQGTLFGRNATGGLVHYVTKDPSPDGGGYISIGRERFDRTRAEGAADVPLSDNVLGRVAFSTIQGDGYQLNRLNPEVKLNNANQISARAKLAVLANENLDFMFQANVGHQDIRTGFFEFVSAVFPNGEPTPGVPVPNLGGYSDNDGDPFAGSFDRPGRNKLDTFGFSAQMNWNLGWADLTNILAFRSVTRDYIEDSDASPADWFNFFLTTDADQWTEEIRLSGNWDRLQWLAGFYYITLDIQDSNGGIVPELFEALFGASVEDLGFNGIRNPYRTQKHSWSPFVHLEYAFSDDITLIAGLRWIDEGISHQYNNFISQFPDTAESGKDPNIVDLFDAVDPFSANQQSGDFAANLQFNFTPNDNLLIYGGWKRGVKSGGFNAPLLPSAPFVTPDFMQFGPEKLDAFEAGIKWQSSDRRFRMNASGYYYDYNNFQAFSIIGLDTFMLNAEAQNAGFEFEFEASPARGLNLRAGIAFIDADITDVPGLTVDAVTPVGTVEAVRPGATVKPVQTPRWNIVGGFTYDIPAWGGTLTFAMTGEWRDKHFFALTATEAVTNEGYFKGNASVSWTDPSDKWNIEFLVRDFTNKHPIVQTFDLSGSIENGGLFGLIEQYYAPPRIWSLAVTRNF